VAFLAFAYNPTVHWQEHLDPAEQEPWAAEVLLAGGADRDRVTWVEPLLRAGIDVALYGGYWHRYAATRAHGRGMLEPSGLRRATATAHVSLGLVRRANRDGHSMRTFEIPAMGGCLLAERTPDHGEFFGADGECVLYVDRPDDVVDRVRWLLANPAERDRLARAAHARVTGGGHTYADRLRTMVEAI
jgi:spore maturation protein CgeB